MIIVKIVGGLGNQMFQYAFGRAISQNLGRALVLDLTAMPTGRAPHLRRWELPDLAIPPIRQIGARGLRINPDRRGQMWQRVVRRGLDAGNPWRIDEPVDDRLLAVSAIPKPIAYFVGYWQSPLYFNDIDVVIRSELRPRNGPTEAVRKVMRSVGDRETIAVHVRRGDYISEPHAAQFHGALQENYYSEAVARIAEIVDNPIAVVFSDDPKWAAENLQLGIQTVHAEQQQGMKAVETLSGMAACSHHVIANSSLSWWGAYLAMHDKQRVIYPNPWFLGRQIDAKLRFPAHWSPHSAD